MNVSGIASGASAVSHGSVSMAASLKTMELAQDALEDTMGMLVESMSAIASGVGGNVDIMA